MRSILLQSCFTLTLGSLLATAACDSEQDNPAKTENPPAAATSQSNNAALNPAEKAEPQAAEPTGRAECPAGRWTYGYADQALEVMMSNAVGAKVVKEEGSFVCEITKGEEGTMTCDTGGKPVVNVIEAKQMGVPMTVSVTIKGKAVTRFTLVEPGKMKLIPTETDSLDIKADVKLGGKQMPFPANKLTGLFGNEPTISNYKCEGDKLMIKPQVEGVNTTWQELKKAGPGVSE